MYVVTEVRPGNARKLLLLVVVGDHNTSNNSGNNSQQEDEKTKTDPPLFASCSCGRDCLVRVFNTGRRRQWWGEISLGVTYPLEASCSMSWAVF